MHLFGGAQHGARLVFGFLPFHLGHRVGDDAGGACGYLSFGGEMDVAIAIRTGVIKDGMSSLDVLRATFPAGTLTGAPKIRAMEIIDELEPVKRGIYGGACGYLSFAGDMDVAIAIRTGVVKDNTLYVQAGAGVVADSVPEMEWKETEAKARAVIRAAELVEEGF